MLNLRRPRQRVLGRGFGSRGAAPANSLFAITMSSVYEGCHGFVSLNCMSVQRSHEQECFTASLDEVRRLSSRL